MGEGEECVCLCVCVSVSVSVSVCVCLPHLPRLLKSAWNHSPIVQNCGVLAKLELIPSTTHTHTQDTHTQDTAQSASLLLRAKMLPYYSTGDRAAAVLNRRKRCFQNQMKDKSRHAFTHSTLSHTHTRTHTHCLSPPHLLTGLESPC